VTVRFFPTDESLPDSQQISAVSNACGFNSENLAPKAVRQHFGRSQRPALRPIVKVQRVAIFIAVWGQFEPGFSRVAIPQPSRPGRCHFVFSRRVDSTLHPGHVSHPTWWTTAYLMCSCKRERT